MIHWSQFPYSKSTQVQFNSISIQHLYYCSTKQFLSPLTNKEIYTPRVLPDCSQVTAPSQSCYVKIYIIIAVGPLYVCLCVSVNSSETVRQIYFILWEKIDIIYGQVLIYVSWPWVKGQGHQRSLNLFTSLIQCNWMACHFDNFIARDLKPEM